MRFAFDEVAHILWGVKKPKVVMTVNKALTRFFQSKRIPLQLWNYCDQELQFDFVLVHVLERKILLPIFVTISYEPARQDPPEAEGRYPSLPRGN